MTTLLTSLACLWFAYLIVRAITIEVALRKMAKRNKAKQELGEKIQRKIERAIEVNLHSIDEHVKGNEQAGRQLYEAGLDESQEIEELIKKWERM